MSEYQWHVLGPGSIGSLFACHLQQAHLHTALLTRSPSEDARLITLQKQGQLATHAFTIDKGPEPIQRLLVTVKAHQTEQALSAIQSRITKHTLVVLLQNGMGSWRIVQRLFPDTPFLLATTTEGAYRAQDHHVVHAGRGCTWFGSLEQQWQSRVPSLIQQWSRMDLEVHFDPEIEARLWQKLAINCAINPLTILYDCKNGELLNNTNAVNDMKIICQELELVLDQILSEPLQPPLYELVKEVARKTGENISSMLQDYRHGKPTEIDFITGYLIEQATSMAIAVPHNKKILDAVKAISF